MKIVGFLTEYNPMHRGHERHIELTRRAAGECALVCVMSGNFVQRGDLAIMNKASRAEAAVRSGVDLVLELPTPLALSSAEKFASSAVRLLHDTGAVDCISFGSECGDAKMLSAAADALLDWRFSEKLKEELAGGISFAAARQAAVRAINKDAADVLASPNDILGVEYMKAIKRFAPELEPIVIKREGSEHDGEGLGELPSASALRNAIFAGNIGGALEGMTEASRSVLLREMEAGRAPVRFETCERAAMAKYRLMSKEDWAATEGAGEGLYHRFFRCARAATGIDAMLAGVKSKRYAYTRIRRTALCAYLGIRAEDAPERAPYIRPLAFNGTGREILAKMKKNAEIPIITKPADVRKTGGAALRMFELEAQCTDLYTLCYPRLCESEGGSEWRISPFIL